MREHKFRAWDGSEMIYDIAVYKDKAIDVFGDDECEFWHEPPLQIMQYTGLKDKNDQDIYEGDIVLYLDGEDRSTESGFDWSEYMNKGEIYWNEGEAMFDVSNKEMTDREAVFEFGEMKIIGNIYENGDLLEDKP